MKLLLVEDSVRLQKSLGTGLRRNGHAVDAAVDGEAALRFVRHNPYDVVILDLMIPRIDGCSVLRTLRSEGIDVGVLILTARDAVEDRVHGLRIGADDYLVKPFAFDELVARLDAITRRREGRTSSTIIVGDLLIDLDSQRVTRQDEELVLTRREYMLLVVLARRQGAIVRRTTIEEYIYDEHDFPLSNAVDRIVCSLRKKLHSTNGPAIRTRRGLGYVLEAGGPS